MRANKFGVNATSTHIVQKTVVPHSIMESNNKRMDEIEKHSARRPTSRLQI